MLWVRSLILLAGLFFSGHAAFAQVGCVPNPNLTPLPFVDGCPLPVAGLNTAFGLFLRQISGNTALRALPISTAAMVLRMDFEPGYGAPPIPFSSNAAVCPAPIGDDGGSCVNVTGGGSWRSSPQNPGMDLRQFGARSDGSADVSAAFLAASKANCGGSLHIAAGQYRFDQPVVLTCGTSFVADQGAVMVDHINPSSPTTFAEWIRLSGTEGSTTPLTSNAVFGSSTVVVTSTAGFTALPGCAGLDGVNVHVGCWVRVQSSDAWDPTILNHHIGELKPICGIAGLTLTLCTPLEDTYNTADTALASPVTMVSGFAWSGGTFQGQGVDADHIGITLHFNYGATVQGVTFQGLNGEGDLIFSDSWFSRDLNNTYIGIGAAATAASDSYAAADENASEYSWHDGMYCYQTGPCWTAAFSPTPGSSTRHSLVTNSVAVNISANNSYAFQTHSMGADYNLYHNSVVNDGDPSATHSQCLGIDVPYAEIIGNKCASTVGTGIYINNYTRRGGAAIISDNVVDGAFVCILAQQGPGSATGAFDSLIVSGNVVSRCQRDGIEVINANNTPLGRLVVSGNEVISADLSAGGYQALAVVTSNGAFGGFEDSSVSNNVIKATAIATSGTGIYLSGIDRGSVTGNSVDALNSPVNALPIEGLDLHYNSFGNNVVRLPLSATGVGIYLTQFQDVCIGNMVSGNIVHDPTPVSSTAFKASNCSNTVVGDNNFLDSPTRITFVGGSGNQSEESVSVSGYPGVDATGATDSSVGFQTAFLANCGGTVTIPAGTYKFTAPVSVNCATTVVMDPNAVISDQRAVPGTTPLVLYTGSIGTAVAVTVDVAAGATSATVSSSASFCQPAGKAPDPNCAVLLRDEETVDVASGAPIVKKGEIRLISSITGNVLSFFGPTDDSYPAASTAKAQPVVLLDHPTWTGGKFVGPNANNGNVAFQYSYAYHPVMRDAVFAQFGQTGVYWENTIAELEDHTTYIGLGANNAGFNNQGSAVMDASAGGIHTHIQCLEGVGPCVTLGQFASPGYGVNRHVQVIANYSENAMNLNDTQVFQTHFGADDIAFIDNTVLFNGNSPTDNSAISLGGASGLIMGNRIISPLKAAAIQVANGTIYDAHVTVSNNVVLGKNKTSARCIYVINEQALSASVGTYQDIKITGNNLSGCDLNGIRVDGDVAGTGAPATYGVIVANNNITNVSGATNNCIFLKGSISRFAVTGNTCRGLSAVAANAILIQDSSYGTVTGNYIELAAAATGIGIRHQCTNAGLPLSGTLVTDSGNVVFSPSGVSDTGIYADNNCTSITIGDNSVATPVTPRRLGTGTGNIISVPLNGVTGSIGGGALGAGVCANGTATVLGVTTAQKNSATAAPQTYPGDTIYWRARVTGNDTVTVYVCSATGSTPTASLYNVTVHGINN